MNSTTLQFSISFVNVIQNLRFQQHNYLPQYSYLPPVVHNFSPSVWQFRVEELVLNNEHNLSIDQISELQQKLLSGGQAQQEVLQQQIWRLVPFYESDRRRDLTFDPFFIPYNFYENKIYRISLNQQNMLQTSELISEKETFLIGELYFTLHEMVLLRTAAHNTRQLLNHAHKIISGLCQLSVIEASEFCNNLHLQFSGSNLMPTDLYLNSCDPFLVLSKYDQNTENFIEFARTSVVYRNNCNPLWEELSCSIQTFCDGDNSKPIKIECFDFDPFLSSDGSNHLLIGSFETSLKELQNSSSKIFELKNSSTNTRKIGYVKLEKLTIEKQFSFLDYLRGGFDISAMFAIDFTASNGTISPKCLHNLQLDKNPYISAINALDVLQYYSSTKLFYSFGFGAKILSQSSSPNLAQFCFPLSLDTAKPHVFGLKGIVTTYSQNLERLQFSGPTIVSQVIRKAISICEHMDSQQYLILVIEIDGEVDDLKETVEEIVNASYLPISILFIGIGDKDFSNLQILNPTNTLLCSTKKRAMRNIVHFVKYSLDLDSNQFKKQLLAHIPEQIVKYLHGKQIEPKQPKQQLQNALFSTPTAHPPSAFVQLVPTQIRSLAGHNFIPQNGSTFKAAAMHHSIVQKPNTPPVVDFQPIQTPTSTTPIPPFIQAAPLFEKSPAASRFWNS